MPKATLSNFYTQEKYIGISLLMVYLIHAVEEYKDMFLKGSY